MKRASHWRHGCLIAAIGLGFVFLWVGGSGYRQDMVVLAMTYGLIALGMYIPFVLGGSLSAAYIAYAAIGAYAVALVGVHTELSLLSGFIGGALASAVVAILLGLATRRLSSFYLVAVTLLFGFAFQRWLIDASTMTGGSLGLLGFRRLEFFGLEVTRTAQMVGAWMLLCLLTILVSVLRESRWGLALRAKREVPLALEATGYRIDILQLSALGLGAAVAALGGSVFATFNRGVNPETFGLNIVFLAVFMPLVGGVSSAWGALVGGLVAVQLTLNSGAIAESGNFLFALFVLFVLLIMPEGLIGMAKLAVRTVASKLRPTHALPTEERS